LYGLISSNVGPECDEQVISTINKNSKSFFFSHFTSDESIGHHDKAFFFFLFLIFQNLNFSIFTGIEGPECAHNFIDIDV
jgi:hypothetical protein